MEHDGNRIPTAELRDLFPGCNLPGAGLTVAVSSLMSFPSNELPMLFSYEQLALAAAVLDCRPECLIEFGTGQGTGTLLLAANAPKGAEIHTVDLREECRGNYTSTILRGDSDIGSAFHASLWKNSIRQLLVRPDEPISSFAHLKNRIDFAFIDGDHAYHGVRSDTLIALELGKADATFLWHDFYDFPDYLGESREKRGVYPWLNELAATGQLSLFHISGTYLVAGRRNWGRPIPSRLRQPGDRPGPFGARIVRQGEA